ncbi:PREDICTED: sodium-dependent phosphate transport protein 3-like [Elephantulus edwardii]|uniref:sodium-dependent phosphate transport protein 3-like n=1 Tax=Elephantulus edwardii TaxID=28737 RepID=UPI0003F060AD|nr:PREDICTED: sodium-dependent phosphate transport protein 3-like [Elephantulus edwardii]
MTKLSPTTEESIHTQDLQLDELIPRKVQSLCTVRYGMAYILHICNFILMTHATIINITMVAMVNGTTHQSQVNISSEELLVNSSDDPHGPSESLPARVPVYNWSPQIQGIIFSSSNYGMLLTLAPSGYLAGRVGTKLVVGVALFGSSVTTLCNPLAANLGLVFLIVIRIVQGICQGSALGGQYALWEKWCPPQERSSICTIATAGLALGPFVAVLSGGFISQVLGWPFAFYIFGAIGCVFTLLWIFLLYNDPISHPWINNSEKEYIISSLAQQVSSSRLPLPVKAMARSLPLWSLLICSFTHQWLATLLVIYIPTYISFAYNINIRDNGLLSSLPYIVAWLFIILGGQLADFLLTKNFKLNTVRKIITLMGVLPSSILIATLPYLRSSYIATITSLTISCALTALCHAGIFINVLDIAPSHSSFLMGVTRGSGQISAILVSTVVGLFLSQDPEFGWRNIFFLIFAVNVLGLLFYLIYGEADIQEWAKERKLTHL